MKTIHPWPSHRQPKTNIYLDALSFDEMCEEIIALMNCYDVHSLNKSSHERDQAELKFLFYRDVRLFFASNRKKSSSTSSG